MSVAPSLLSGAFTNSLQIKSFTTSGTELLLIAWPNAVFDTCTSQVRILWNVSSWLSPLKGVELFELNNCQIITPRLQRSFSNRAKEAAPELINSGGMYSSVPTNSSANAYWILGIFNELTFFIWGFTSSLSRTVSLLALPKSANTRFQFSLTKKFYGFKSLWTTLFSRR